MLNKIKNLPNSAGVYQYFDKHHRILYIGKAKNLKKRVKSYWRFTPYLQPNPNLSARITKMLQQATYLEYIVVDNENDALILENSLIKQLKPKYNILLRDDKTYPYIYIDESQKFPRFELTRKIIKGKKIIYYGPFPNGAKVLLDTLYEVFPLVQKKSCIKEGKACLFYQIDKCLAPCEGKISQIEYQEIINRAKEAILKRDILIEILKEKMIKLASQERFEEATTIRDNIKIIESLNINSDIDLAKQEDLDIFAIINDGSKGAIVKLFMRYGKIISSDFSIFRNRDIFDKNEAYKQALLEFYNQESPQIIKTILVAHKFDDIEDIKNLLRDRFNKKIDILYPQRGTKAKLIKLAIKNGKEILKLDNTKDSKIELEIYNLLGLNNMPYRVEIFDNSHMMGVASVGAMVVWSDGKWNKSSYRKYSLKAKDEYAQMKEMLSRRIKDFAQNSPPDLWVIDGGDTLLQLALKLIDKAGVNIDIIAIAKEKLDAKAYRAKGRARDIIYTKESVFNLQPTDKRLQWIQRLRDEAHRFALSYHKKRKLKEDSQISLLEKKGIGSATIKKLLDYFGTFKAINSASFEEISVASSQKIAKILKT
jgi:excinuclease ABC subunit C